MKNDTLTTLGFVSLSLGLLMVVGGLMQFTITANNGSQLANIQNISADVEKNDTYPVEDATTVQTNDVQTDLFNISEIIEKVQEELDSEI